MYTEQTAQMLCTINITWALSCKLTPCLNDPVAYLNVLLTFKASGVSSHDHESQHETLTGREEFDQDISQSTPSNQLQPHPGCRLVHCQVVFEAFRIRDSHSE